MQPQKQPEQTTGLYDQYGRPVDAAQLQQFHTEEAAAQPQVVHLTRPIEPAQVVISEKVRLRHEQSKQDYPELNLSEGEYVISAVRRHPIGLLSIWVVAGAAITVLIGFILLMMNGYFGSSELLSGNAASSFALMLLMVAALVFLGGMIATVTYDANRFYLTNESVTQHIQSSPFSKKEQTISLGNIEDASFTQVGIIQNTLNYGSLRLSTEGDETTYRFSFVANPSNQITLLNNAVEAFKNGRPVDTDESDAPNYQRH